MDRNDYYGGESTSLNLIQVGNRLFVHVWTISLYKFIILSFMLSQLWKKFRGNDKPPADLGPSRDYNVDMMPKVCFVFSFLSANFFVCS